MRPAERLVGALLLVGLSSCAGFQPVADTQPCLEAGYAIAYVTEACTGDRELGNQRYEDFRDQFTCLATPPEDGVPGVDSADTAAPGPEDLYECAFAISQLDCAVVEDFGGRIGMYLNVSPACPLVAERKAGGGR
ncbi:MAG: hypothetical protein RL071_4482 [Pseudomonadota bacterium]|jgi:hypothetical protein